MSNSPDPQEDPQPPVTPVSGGAADRSAWVLALVLLCSLAALYTAFGPEGPDEALLAEWELDCRGKVRKDVKGFGCMTGCQITACSRLCRTGKASFLDEYGWACKRLEDLQLHQVGRRNGRTCVSPASVVRMNRHPVRERRSLDLVAEGHLQPLLRGTGLPLLIGGPLGPGFGDLHARLPGMTDD
jgi:hypothetical protein